MKLFIERISYSINDSGNYSKNNLLFIVLVLIGLMVIFSYGIGNVSAASNANIYVNTGGNDSWDGQYGTHESGTLSGPKLSIKNATGTVDPDGTVNIANGQYKGINNTEITIDKNMHIQGQSETDTIINGTNTNWIFNINSGITVLISNLTLTNGTGNNGGAIENDGGAIYNSGTLTVERTNFTNNYGVYGGAIDNFGDLNITSSTFSGNIAGYDGGAICSWGGNLNVVDCNFINSRVLGNGGAICSYGGILNVTSSNFLNNTADSYGGAIFNADTSILHFNRFYKNSSPKGNVIFNYISSSIVNAENNWWGSNAGPSTEDIAGHGTITSTPWLVLTVSITNNGNSATADLLHDSNGIIHDLSNGCVPDGIPVNFSTNLGTIGSQSSIFNGIAVTTLNSGSSGITPLVSAKVDNQIAQSSPTVISINPGNNTKTNIVNKIINIYFNEPIKSGSVYGDISITGPLGNVSITKNINGNVLTLIPTSNYTNGNYYLNIPINAVTDLTGNGLVTAFSSNFIIDTIPPTASATPTSGLYNTTKTVSLKMSETGTIYYTKNGTTPTTSSAKYTTPITVSTTTTLKYIAIDKAGNKSPVYTAKYTIDKSTPKVATTTPTNLKTGVSRTNTITLQFNENIKNSTYYNNIKVKNLTTGKYVTITKSISGNTLSIKTSSTRSKYTWYQIIIPKAAIKDMAGNNLAENYTFKFKTGK